MRPTDVSGWTLTVYVEPLFVAETTVGLLEEGVRAGGTWVDSAWAASGWRTHSPAPATCQTLLDSKPGTQLQASGRTPNRSATGGCQGRGMLQHFGRLPPLPARHRAARRCCARQAPVRQPGSRTPGSQAAPTSHGSSVGGSPVKGQSIFLDDCLAAFRAVASYSHGRALG